MPQLERGSSMAGQSFAYGAVAIENLRITREMVDRAADEIAFPTIVTARLTASRKSESQTLSQG